MARVPGVVWVGECYEREYGGRPMETSDKSTATLDQGYCAGHAISCCASAAGIVISLRGRPGAVSGHGRCAGRDQFMRYDLFISHSSADAETALAVVAGFENRNITCWMAPRDIPMGSSYHEEIVAAIENSRAVLLLFSGAANKSEHVLREVELAAQGKKPILPLRIDVSAPAGGLKYMLANKQWVERKALGNRLVDEIEKRWARSRPIHSGVDPVE